MKTLVEIRSEICSLRSKVEELQADAREIADEDTLDFPEADSLYNSLDDIAADLAELEND